MFGIMFGGMFIKSCFEAPFSFSNVRIAASANGCSQLGLRYGLATRLNKFEVMTIAEDVWEQISRQNLMKEGQYIPQKIKNSLRAFSFNYIDLDLKEFR